MAATVLRCVGNVSVPYDKHRTFGGPTGPQRERKKEKNRCVGIDDVDMKVNKTEVIFNKRETCSHTFDYGLRTAILSRSHTHTHTQPEHVTHTHRERERERERERLTKPAASERVACLYRRA